MHAAQGNRSPVFFNSFATLSLACALILPSCAQPVDETQPVAVVTAWVEKMAAAGDDKQALRDAVAMLGPAARASLAERAQRATTVEGRRVAPYEMLAGGWFLPRFHVKSMRATKNGELAEVLVTGVEPGERAVVRCVREAGKWHVEPHLP